MISQEQEFLALAILSSKRSPDPHCQVGACIVNPEGKVLGLGYNSHPEGCETLPWGRRSEEQKSGFLRTKHPYVCHAEMNCILNALTLSNLKRCVIYATHFPCNECAKLIIQVGISKVFYLHNLKQDSESSRASRIMFDLKGIIYKQISPC